MYFLVPAIAVVLTSYIFLVLVLIRGWLRARHRLQPESNEIFFISVVIPARNEAASIGTLLNQLQSLNYPQFEVIVVDDHSEDETSAIVKSFADSRIRVIQNNGVGKKSAITTGVQQARGGIIVTTDSDCQVTREWLHHINRYFARRDTMLVFGGVSIQGETFFTDIQAIEFSSLIGSGVSLWALGHPVMCNGANLAFRKHVFEELGGYVGNDHIASGDDEFLMRKILSLYPDGISFLNMEEGNVQTKPAPDVNAFIQQRLRWAGKWRHNQSNFSKLVAIYVLIVQLTLIAAFALLIFSGNTGLMMAMGFLLAMRLVAEFFFVHSVCRFLKVRWRWDAFLFLQFIYPFYVVGIGLFSNLSAVKWKDRNI